MPDLTSEVKNNSGIPSFDFEEFPVGYFSDNIKGKLLRKQLIKNQLKISECNVGDLEKTFFSKENIDLINKQLILNVFYKTNKQIKLGNQSKDSLLIVMRYVFIEYAKHLPYNIIEQIIELNNYVIKEILPLVMTNIDQKINYLKEINNPRQLIDPPINISKTKPLKSITSVIF